HLWQRDDGVVAYAKKVAEEKALLSSGVSEPFTGFDAAEPARAQDIAWVKAVLPTDVDALAERFKDEASPLRLVFVCSMWITGFDAKSCGVVYLDKPMANHTLMQTIARANRVYPGKEFGLVVDYVGVLRNLQRAFEAYEKERTGKSIDRPVADKAVVLATLEKEVRAVDESCARVGVSLDAVWVVDRVARVKAIEDAVERFARDPKEREVFRGLVSRVDRLYRALGEDARRDVFDDRHAAMTTLSRAMAAVEGTRDFTAILDALDRVVDGVIDADADRPVATVEGFDLTELDLAAIAAVESSKRPATAAMALGSLIRAVARAEATTNPTLLGLQKRVEDALADYAEGARALPGLLSELKSAAEALKAHQARAAREGLTRVQLTDYDAALATLGAKGDDAGVREGMKTALRALAESLPSAMGLDWRATDQGRSRVQVAVRDALASGLKGRVTDGEMERLRELQFQRVYERGG
ncbi:MAG: DUF3387 domain-containing protein, partial [Polyangiales bacterium]